MRHPPPTLTLILLLAIGLAFGTETAARSSPPALFLSAAKKAKTRHHPPRETGQIACTIAGCHRIPPECHPEMGYDINGIPTGFDIVVCPAPRRR